MAYGISFEATLSGTVLFLLVLLQAALVWEEVRAAPAKRNDILAGTEFLSVFINGAMAPAPQRRRGFRRGGHSSTGHSSSSSSSSSSAPGSIGSSSVAAAAAAAAAAAVASSSLGDSVTSESQHEASIYRISRNPAGRNGMTRTQNSATGRSDEVVRFYPISHQRTLENGQQNLASMMEELGTTTSFSPKITTTTTTTANGEATRSNGTANSSGAAKVASRQKVIGVSVTSTVEATPYKVRVEHYDSSDAAVVTRPPTVVSSVAKESGKPGASTTRTASRSVTDRSTLPASTTTTSTTTTTTTTTTTVMTPIPARLVTEELTNIVSESNRSEFSVDEGLPRTSWRQHASVTPRTAVKHTSVYGLSDQQRMEDDESGTTLGNDNSARTETPEENYELPEENSEPHEIHEEPMEIDSEQQIQPQGRKAGRHYEGSHFNRATSKYDQSSKAYKSSRQYSEPAKIYSEPAKVYGEPEKVYGEPAKVYSEPAKVYGEPAKVYSEPAKVYSEPAKVYGEPEKVYGEPAKVYSEPAKIYSEPAKVYSQPSKIYSEPSKVYNSEGQPLRHDQSGEPDEENYEVDESVSVGSNGKVYGPQLMVTEAPNSSDMEDGHKVRYVEEDRNYRYMVEKRTPDGFIVGEYGVLNHDDGSLTGVRYTAEGTTDPKLIYDALMKFLAL